MKIGTFDFDKNSQVFIIAELSANHGQDINIAVESIKAAKRAGADAVKLQTYTPDTITIDCKSPEFKISKGTSWDGQYLYDLYKEAYMPWDWHKRLFEVAENEGLICFSSPFDFTAVDLLYDLKVPAFKIASFEITDIPLIKYVASKQKPVILSTGIAGEEDIRLAINACISSGNSDIALLKCTSGYPTPIEEANLLMIKEFERTFQVVPGLSDHTMGIIAPVVATSLGARIIEKHFILDKTIGGPDAHFSLTESEFGEMVRSVRQASQSLGKTDYTLSDKQQKGRYFSRSIYIVSDVEKGERISKENVRSIRPGNGLHPKHYYEILDKHFNAAYKKGTPFKLSMIND